MYTNNDGKPNFQMLMALFIGITSKALGRRYDKRFSPGWAWQTEAPGYRWPLARRAPFVVFTCSSEPGAVCATRLPRLRARPHRRRGATRHSLRTATVHDRNQALPQQGTELLLLRELQHGPGRYSYRLSPVSEFLRQLTHQGLYALKLAPPCP